MAELTVVGKPVTRVDANEKVTGQIVYGYDLVAAQHALWQDAVQPKAHAKIKKINTEKAKPLPGVVAVVTGEDAPWTHGEVDQRQTVPRSRQSALYRRTCGRGSGGR